MEICDSEQDSSINNKGDGQERVRNRDRFQTDQIIDFPKQLFICKICQEIFIEPITLSCGHTFCRSCINGNSMQTYGNRAYSMEQNSQKIICCESMETNLRRKKEIATCQQCSAIIWKSIRHISPNIAIKSLIDKHHSTSKRLRNPINESSHTEQAPMANTQSMFYNKILLRLKEPETMLMPQCHGQIQFQTCFIEQIAEQADQIVINWGSLQEQGLGLLCSLTNINSVLTDPHLSKIVIENQSQISIPSEAFKAHVFGRAFVRLTEIGWVAVNIRDKFTIVTDRKINKIFTDLEICDCAVFHAVNSNTIQIEDFDHFFSFYDKMNDLHYLKQIYQYISERPFNDRNKTEDMMYCALRVLRLPNKQLNELVLSFDDSFRIKCIQQFLNKTGNLPLDEILRIKIPGKFNSLLIFMFAIFIITMNLIQLH